MRFVQGRARREPYLSPLVFYAGYVRRLAKVLCLNPRLAEFAARLEIGNLVLVAQRQTDIVPALQQTLLAEGIDLEFDAAAVRAAHLLLFEIDADDRVGTALGVIHESVHVGLRQRDGQDAVLETIVIENIGKRRRDNTANAEIEKRPRRVLSARAAAEIRTRYKDLRLPVGRL